MLSISYKTPNNAIGMVISSAYDTSVLTFIRQLGSPTIDELVKSDTLKIVYKSVYDQSPTYLIEMFIRLFDSCKRELRNATTDFSLPLFQLPSGQKCFLHKDTKP